MIRVSSNNVKISESIIVKNMEQLWKHLIYTQVIRLKLEQAVFWDLVLKPLANVDLGGSSPIAPEYQSVFNRLLEKYK